MKIPKISRKTGMVIDTGLVAFWTYYAGHVFRAHTFHTTFDMITIICCMYLAYRALDRLQEGFKK